MDEQEASKTAADMVSKFSYMLPDTDAVRVKITNLVAAELLRVQREAAEECVRIAKSEVQDWDLPVDQAVVASSRSIAAKIRAKFPRAK